MNTYFDIKITFIFLAANDTIDARIFLIYLCIIYEMKQILGITNSQRFLYTPYCTTKMVSNQMLIL